MKNLKKILGATIVLIAFSAAANAQAPANAPADAQARIVPAILIRNERMLNFGNIVPLTGGTVVIGAIEAGTRSSTGALVLAPGLTSSARFEVEGDGGSTYSISRLPLLGTPLVLTNIAAGAETMNVDLVVSADGAAGVESVAGLLGGTTGANGFQKIFVGGTLTVAASQAAGTYQNNGGIVITVDYN